MPRSKPVPRHLDERAQRSAEWDLHEAGEPSCIDGIEESPPTYENEVEDGADAMFVDDGDAATVDDDDEPLPPPKMPRRSRRRKAKVLDPVLSGLLGQCDFYVALSKRGSISRDDCLCRMGSFEIRLKPTDEDVGQVVKEQDEFWLYVGETRASCFLYFEDKIDGVSNSAHVFIEDMPSYDFCFCLRAARISKNKTFYLRCGEYNGDERTLSVDVLLRRSGVRNVAHPSEDAKSMEMSAIVEQFNGISLQGSGMKEKTLWHDINILFEAIKKIHEKKITEPRSDVQHYNLLPVLRPYQKVAVQWMLDQENASADSQHVADSLHELYVPLSVDGVEMYYNKPGDFVVLDRPTKIARKPGGILADEMGLGKSVEVLACILCHPRPPSTLPTDQDQETRVFDIHPVADANGTSPGSGIVNGGARKKKARKRKNTVRSSSVTFASRSSFECVCGASEESADGSDKVQCEKCGLWQHMDCVKYERELGPYFCPHCWVLETQTPVTSGATLIVSPSSILSQWVDETELHLRANSLRVFNYPGIYKHGYVQPRTLAKYDVVLTTYEVLRKEIDYVGLPHTNSEDSRCLRRPKRFMAVPSPLVAVEWWRICLDEAQMVESTTSKTAEMALRLAAVNRWCVTGTPIQKSIEDLQGLLKFLGCDPYGVKRWWRKCLCEPYCNGEPDAFYKVLSTYLWRTCKKDVIDQINLPPQTEHIHWLRFTPIEEHFYRQQYSDCSLAADKQFDQVVNLEVTLSSMDRKILSKLLAPLIRLRQACCHPQAVRGQFMSLNKNALTMAELLEVLVKKTKLDAEEAHRMHVSSLNALAGISIIEEQWVEASERYREVLRIANEQAAKIKTDRLQRLHALHNLAELLEAGHENIPPTLRDSDLRIEAERLREEYLAKCAAKVTASHETLAGARQLVAEAENNFRCSESWWVTVLQMALDQGKLNDLISRIQNELTAVYGYRNSFSRRFRDMYVLKYLTMRRETMLVDNRSNLVRAFEDLQSYPNEGQISAAVDCHLRPVTRNQKKCLYCQINTLFNAYEATLFNFIEDSPTGADAESNEGASGRQRRVKATRRGTWADSEHEHILKIIQSFAKLQSVDRSIIQDGKNHVKLFDALKKEFKGLRGVWMQIRDQVSALDELNMATVRLRLRLPEEVDLEMLPLNVLEPTQIENHRLKYVSDCVLATGEKNKKLGQLQYLHNLGKRDGSNPQSCPICHRVLGDQWSVLQCGHCYCFDCLRSMIKHDTVAGRLTAIKCPTCRQYTKPLEVSYVNTKSEESDEVQQIEVKGSYSTKIEGITRTLLQIKQTEPDAKVLVFSTWQNVLDVLVKALIDNDITFATLTAKTKYEVNLTNFKKDPSIMCLLMLVHTGAKGLNLVEATHVLFVEPILNPASELQAKGRVHRIGQTKPTKVHHFLVRGTIEERMNRLLRQHSAHASNQNTEENTLTLAELKDLFSEDAPS